MVSGASRGQRGEQPDPPAFGVGEGVDRSAERDQAAAPIRMGGGEQDAGVPAPRVPDPVDRFADSQMIQHLDGWNAARTRTTGGRS
jgi:hypothetical protein